MRVQFVFALVVALLLAANGALSAFAQAPARERALAWGVRAFVGNGYTSVFSPPQVPVVYLLAGGTHMISLRYTQVYYWPIDREYKPDWASLNQPVTGTLEVLQNGQLIQEVLPQKFLIKLDRGPANPANQLLLGDIAEQAYKAYLAQRSEYLEQVAAYDAQLEEYLNAKENNPRANLTPPMPPAPFSESLPPPEDGFALELPLGEFQVRLRDAAGQIVPGSTRQVRSIGPLQTSIGYRVIPESKWTIPESSYDPNEVIYYSVNGTTMYLVPITIQEFNFQDYVRLTKPQDTLASAERSVWVEGGTIRDATLVVRQDGQQSSQLTMRPFAVKQLPGPALGYEIVPFDSAQSKAPDLEAMPVTAAEGVRELHIELLADDHVIPRSERTMLRAQEHLPTFTYGLVLAPLAIGAATLLVCARRRKRSRRILSHVSG